MKVRYLLLISLLIVGALFVPAVSAETIEGQIHDATLTREEISAIADGSHPSAYGFSDLVIEYDPIAGLIPSAIYLHDIRLYPTTPKRYADFPQYQEYDVVLKHSDTVLCNVKLEFFVHEFVQVDAYDWRTGGNVRMRFTDWNYEYLRTLTEKTTFTFGQLPTTDTHLMMIRLGATFPSGDFPVKFVRNGYNTQPASLSGYHEYFYESDYFTNNYTISTDEYRTDIYVTRIFGDDINPSKIIVSKSDGTELYKSSKYETANQHYAFLYGDLIIDIESVYGKTYRISEDTIPPTDPDSPPLRTGIVTMTDDNGVMIYGFEVTAVNHYTGESYTVSTETDVAVITLPMDRITEIRNPQTGEYEEAPVGYYTFYGQAPGYKMLFDDGIRVRVMPEKYGSYKFCDIGVTADNGFTPTLRTGSVTMMDHNGTSITGFEVTAVNYYTGESYTVSTDTDVAVISLPMDRTAEIRNPQTGVYEEAPVGYYTFYGQAPGYKMLHEDGIRVRVMPEKYGSYKLCDILVTSESGPLSGKHQFHIRSRADNSVLQSGTISAQSTTTGEWYNTTVTNGIATLILPYDTSDAISEYAGHYYVYATSPGYEDSDYGTQIGVYPHTVSEVKTILLTPIGGVPTPGNVTLRIEAFSETGQDVPNAEIFITGVLGAGKDVWDTYTASSTGYLEVSVPGNSTYAIVARGAGYYDSSRRIEVFTEDPDLIEIRLYLSGAPTVEPTTEPTGWPTGPPTTQPTGGIPDEDDDSDGFMIQAVRGIANLFGVSFGIGKTILGMLLALAIGMATAKQLKGGAQEFGMGMLGGVVLGVLIGLLPIWVLVLLVLIIGLWIGQRYMSGGDS